jgi:hypothetical protein
MQALRGGENFRGCGGGHVRLAIDHSRDCFRSDTSERSDVPYGRALLQLCAASGI